MLLEKEIMVLNHRGVLLLIYTTAEPEKIRGGLEASDHGGGE